MRYFLWAILVVVGIQSSELARQVVAATGGTAPTSESVERAVPSNSTPLLNKAVSGIVNLGNEIKKHLPIANSDAEEPSVLIWLHVSRDYLAKFVEREVNQEKEARDNVLGITFTGTSRTTGKTRLELKASDQGALAEVVFDGNIRSNTRGRKGPATLHYHVNSQVHATKQIIVNERGLETRSATAQAPTRLTLVGVNTGLPGLRGLIAERIARRRAEARLAEANAIVSDHRENDVRKGLNERLDARIAELHSQLKTQLATMKLEGGNGISFRSRSTPQYLEVAVYGAGKNSTKPDMPHFELKGNPNLSLRVHRKILARILADGELRTRLVSSFGQVFQARLMGGNVSNDAKANGSLDGEWLAFDVADASQLAVPARVAAENDGETRLR
jgi:hypothetical protein